MSILELVTVPARAKALLAAAAAMALLCLGLTSWALLERAAAFQARGEAAQARAERDRAIDQAAVLGAAASACTASVEDAKAVAAGALAATEKLVDAARRRSEPARHTVERIETILERPAPPGAGCDRAWDELEHLHRKAGAP